MGLHELVEADTENNEPIEFGHANAARILEITSTAKRGSTASLVGRVIGQLNTVEMIRTQSRRTSN